MSITSLDAGLAFAEGLAIVASPCILPVLPLLLAASLEGGRRRPVGIICGFALSFTLFALFSRAVVAALHIGPESIKYASLLLLYLFGFILLSDYYSQKFSAGTQKIANLGGNVSFGGQGFLSGLGIGALIGLVWTPCAGPILAAVLVQAIRQQTDAAGMLVTLCFSVGAGVPMFCIALGGRALMQRLGFLSRYAGAVRKAFGLIIIFSATLIASGLDVQLQLVLSGGKKMQAYQSFMLPRGPYAAPELTGIDGWLNSGPLTIGGLKGKVVLIDFWTYSCINCIRTLPYVNGWESAYRDKGLVIIGVHSPEFEFEKNPENVKAALLRFGIHYPVALDNHLDTWEAFSNHYWPAHYLIDRKGNVVYHHFGEGGYLATENTIRNLLGMPLLAAAQANASQNPNHTVNQTPETYLGLERGERFAAQPLLFPGGQYHFPAELPLHAWALEGQWSREREKLVSGGSHSALRFHFLASKVFLIMGAPAGKTANVRLLLNGRLESTISVGGQKLYTLVSQPRDKEGLLELDMDTAGVECYAFTFGN